MPKRDEPLPDFSDVFVKLKPIFGVAPGMYLAVLYALMVLALIFLFLFLPGIRNNGTVIAFETDPPGAAIWVDGSYRGATPAKVFVARGDRTVELRKAYYTIEREQLSVGGKVFGTLLFPRRDSLEKTLAVGDWSGLINWTRAELVQWGMLKEFSRAAPLPPVLSEAAAAARSTTDPAFSEALQSVAVELAFFTDSEAELRELISGLALLETRGGPFFSVSLANLVGTFRELSEPVDTLVYWFVAAFEASIRAGGVARPLIDTDAFARFHTTYLAGLPEEQSPPVRDNRAPVAVNGVTLQPVPGGVLRAGRSPQESLGRIDPLMPHRVAVEPFYMSRTEVTRAAFARFLLEALDWRPETVDQPGYLEGWTGTEFPDGTGGLPVTHVSHDAARAFCDWMTGTLPSRFDGFEVRLPSEPEWDWATLGGGPARVDGVFLENGSLQDAALGVANSFGLIGLWGGVWEWTADWYFPVSNLLVSRDPEKNPLSGDALGSQRIVKGGSWANRRQEIRLETRGAQPPDWTTPYTGFRIVLAPVED